MIKLLNKVPNKVVIACSGGVDSMAALSFLNNGKRQVSVAYMNHGTPYSDLAQSFVEDYCRSKNLPLVVGYCKNEKSKKESQEEYWRNERHAFLKSFIEPVVLAHNLNDQMENWIFTNLHGEARLIPFRNANLIRPFILNSRCALEEWCLNHQVNWVEDPSNNDTKYMRNKIRHEIMPSLLEVNPGLAKVITKKILKEFTNAD